jgi:integrase
MTTTNIAPAVVPRDQPSGPKLLDRVREAIRLRHYSRRTEESYVAWIRRFIVFHGKRLPSELGSEEIGQYLVHLAVQRKVSASTQNQALSALLFLYRHILGSEPGPIEHVPHAHTPLRVPVVLSADEVRAVLNQLTGVSWLIGSLLYGAGLRLQGWLELRVKDIDFERRNGLGLAVRVSCRAHLPRPAIWSAVTCTSPSFNAPSPQPSGTPEFRRGPVAPHSTIHLRRT